MGKGGGEGGGKKIGPMTSFVVVHAVGEMAKKRKIELLRRSFFEMRGDKEGRGKKVNDRGRRRLRGAEGENFAAALMGVGGERTRRGMCRR